MSSRIVPIVTVFVLIAGTSYGTYRLFKSIDQDVAERRELFARPCSIDQAKKQLWLKNAHTFENAVNIKSIACRDECSGVPAVARGVQCDGVLESVTPVRYTCNESACNWNEIR